MSTTPFVITVQGKRRDIPLVVGDVTDLDYRPAGEDGPRFQAHVRVTRIISRRRRLRGQHDIYLEPLT